MVERLAQPQQIAFAGKLNTQFLADQAPAAVATHEISGADVLGGAIAGFHACGDAFGVLPQREELAAEPHRDRGNRIGDGFQQRLERVLRDELIRLERQRPIIHCPRIDLCLRNRRIGQIQERRLVERENDVDVHGAIGTQSGVADFARESHTAIDFHSARIDALHLRQKCRARLLLDESASHPALAEVDGERQPGRSGAHNQNIAIHCASSVGRVVISPITSEATRRSVR